MTNQAPKKVVKVNAAGIDVAALIRHAEAKDANLMACLAYFVVASCGTGFVTYEQVAAAYNVTEWTVSRWVERLEELGLLELTSGGKGVIIANVLSKFAYTDGDMECQAKVDEKGVITELACGVSKNAKSAPPPQTPPPAKDDKKVEMMGLDSLKFERFDLAYKTLLKCDTMMERVKRYGEKKVKQVLVSIVKNPMFDKLQLDREMLDAEAWLVQKSKGYTDIGRFLMNWVRNSAKAKAKTTATPNAAVKGKYDALQSKAKAVHPGKHPLFMSNDDAFDAAEQDEEKPEPKRKPIWPT